MNSKIFGILPQVVPCEKSKIYIYIYIRVAGGEGVLGFGVHEILDFSQGTTCGKNSEKFGVHEIFANFLPILKLFLYFYAIFSLKMPLSLNCWQF